MERISRANMIGDNVKKFRKKKMGEKGKKAKIFWKCVQISNKKG